MKLFSRLFYFILFVPAAIILRLCGWRGLRIGFDAEAASYWEDRKPGQTGPDAAKRQF